MTAKRFTYNEDTCFVCDNETGYCYHMFKNRDGREMEELLNALHEENVKLKKPNCRNCIHFSCDSVAYYCMEQDYKMIDGLLDCAGDCKDYESVFE